MSWNFGYKRIKMSNDRLENILLIKINDPVLRKIHKDFNNIFGFTGNKIFTFQKRIGNGIYVLQAKKTLEKTRNPYLVHQSKE